MLPQDLFQLSTSNLCFVRHFHQQQKKKKKKRNINSKNCQMAYTIWNNQPNKWFRIGLCLTHTHTHTHIYKGKRQSLTHLWKKKKEYEKDKKNKLNEHLSNRSKKPNLWNR